MNFGIGGWECLNHRKCGSYYANRALCIFWGEGLKEGAENLKKS